MHFMGQFIFEDWMGNKIKEGDTVCLVITKVVYPRMGWWTPGGTSWFEKKEDESVWQIGAEFKCTSIDKKQGCMISTSMQDSGYTYTYAGSLGAYLQTMGDYLIAIKGLSDQDPIEEIKQLL